MKRALRVLLALVVATTILGGAFTGTAAAQANVDDIDLSDDDLIDVSVNAGNPSIGTAVNAGNIGSGDQTAVADSTAVSNAGNFIDSDN